MKATSITAGAWNPIPPTATTNPSVAARLYPGAVDATPITRLDTQPSAPVFRPFSPAPAPSGSLAGIGTAALSKFSPSRKPAVARVGVSPGHVGPDWPPRRPEPKNHDESSQGAKALKVEPQVVHVV